jgi:cell filamentation protein
VSLSDPYVYPGTHVLRNHFGITDPRKLDRIERRLATQRVAEGIPTGAFDLTHLKAIHHHLFQDVYDWAGEVRTVEISKSGSQFQFCRFIETGMADVHRRLEASDYLHGLSREDFATQAGQIIGDVNYVHPFREGNGRTQLQYLKQLAQQAGRDIDLTRFDPAQWLEASKAAYLGNYEGMAAEILNALA